jgi:hypothetical protein
LSYGRAVFRLLGHKKKPRTWRGFSTAWWRP